MRQICFYPSVAIFLITGFLKDYWVHSYFPFQSKEERNRFCKTIQFDISKYLFIYFIIKNVFFIDFFHEKKKLFKFRIPVFLEDICQSMIDNKATMLQCRAKFRILYTDHSG